MQITAGINCSKITSICVSGNSASTDYEKGELELMRTTVNLDHYQEI